MKKLFAIVLALAMCLSVASFAAAEAADPAKTLTEGRWVYSFPVEGMGDFVYYFHFYENVPGYGGVYYAGFALNQLNFAGTWTVEAKECEYTVYMNRGDEATVTATAPYTITFSDWNGKLVEQCAFDGEKIYNDMEKIYGMYSGPCVYIQASVDSKFAEVYEAEKDMAIMDFVAEDPTCTMTIYHNGRYMDLVNMMVEGNWAMEEAEDGSRVYTLTPDEDYDTPAKLTVAADGATAQYSNDDGDEMAMTATATGPVVSYAMAGVFPFMEGVNADLSLALYEGGTCALIVDVFGNVATLDQGAWSMAEDGYTFNFIFTKAGELATALNMETFAVELSYAQAGTDIGDVNAVLTLIVE